MVYQKEQKIELWYIPQLIDSFHIVSAHAPNCLVPRYLREITREGATSI